VTGLAVQQVGGAVVVQGDCLQHLIASVLALIREMQRNGYAPPSALADLLTKAHAARMSQPRHEFASYQVVESHSEGQDVDDWIDVAEAATVLAISRRHVQRLAPSLSPGDAKRIGNSWALRKAPVLALANERRKRKK
jgi:hypothetical protein